MNKYIFELKEEIALLNFKIKLLESITDIHLDDLSPKIIFNDNQYKKYWKATDLGTMRYMYPVTRYEYYVRYIEFEINGHSFVVEFNKSDLQDYSNPNYMAVIQREIVMTKQILSVKIYDLLTYTNYI